MLIKKKEKKKAEKEKNQTEFSCICRVCCKCVRRNYAATGESPSRVPLKAALSHLPANGQRGEQNPEDRSEVVFKGKGIDECKCVHPFVFLKDVRVKCVKHMEN